MNKKPGRVWINFKELRARLKFEDVLRHYGVEIKRKGGQHQGLCPLPSHNGKGTTPSFSANLERGIFQCFGCGAHGNLLEFAVMMTGASPDDGDALRSVAVELQKRFLPQGSGTRPKPSADTQALTETKAPEVIVNEPLDFELKGLDAMHPYLERRGITRETAAQFGVGYCSRGLLEGRLAIPLRVEGGLLGYAGRVVDDAAVSEENPKYRFPSRRERGGRIYEFQKERVIYNGHRFRVPCADLLVVSGFVSVWWLTQQGFPAVVATMGADCSEEQSEAIVRSVKPDGHVWVMPNGDETGAQLARAVLAQVSPHRFVRWVQIKDGRKPSALNKAELKSLLV